VEVHVYPLTCFSWLAL